MDRSLPQGWRMVRLAEVADTALGKMLDAARPKGSIRVPYLRNINVQWGRIDTNNLSEVDLSPEERTRFELCPCQCRLKTGPVVPRWFLLTVATPPRFWSRVVVVSSCEEGAGAASAVGQASVVHGAARAGVEHSRGGPRSGGVPHDGPRWPGTSRSLSPSARRSTSATPDRLGSAARTRCEYRRRLGWAVQSGWCRQLEVTLENIDRLVGASFV